MKIIEQREFTALCCGRNGEKVIETLLIGPQPEGTWILSHLGSAREVVSAEEARRSESALEALDALTRGGGDLNLDSYFQDLNDPARPPGGFNTKEE